MAKDNTERAYYKIFERLRFYFFLGRYAELGITQLGARIFELKEKGYVFKKERVKRLNRYGREIAFDKYSLAEVGA